MHLSTSICKSRISCKPFPVWPECCYWVCRLASSVAPWVCRPGKWLAFNSYNSYFDFLMLAKIRLLYYSWIGLRLYPHQAGRGHVSATNAAAALGGRSGPYRRLDRRQRIRRLVRRQRTPQGHRQSDAHLEMKLVKNALKRVHGKKRLTIFPSPAGMSLTKLSHSLWPEIS